MKQYIVLLFLISLSFTNCNSQNKTFKTVSSTQFEQIIKTEKTVQLLDVRTAQEYESGHLKNAKNSNWNSDDFVASVANLEKSKPVLVYCKVGGRSAKAAQKLTELGFKNVINLDGGIDSWTSSGLPILK